VPKFSFICSRCGRTHEGSPSFAYSAPIYYEQLNEGDKRTLATISDDFCEITQTDQTDRFIRTILEIPINGVEEPFLWGVWVSLSEGNFDKYMENFDSPTYEDEYFGWFSNRLPYYPDTLNLKAQAFVKPGRERPLIQLEPTDHPLSIDSRAGISWQKAMEIAEIAMHDV
jgi:hypothetical protein